MKNLSLLLPLTLSRELFLTDEIVLEIPELRSGINLGISLDALQELRKIMIAYFPSAEREINPANTCNKVPFTPGFIEFCQTQ